jgi:membrane protease YdiL (CAAX protease family)
MDLRAKRIVWGFLVGVTLLEGGLIYFSFPEILTDTTRIRHYTFVPPGTPTAWLLAAAATIAYVTYAALRSPVIRAHMLAPATWGTFIGVRLIALPMAFVTGFFEEAFFRKLLMNLAMHHGYGPIEQVAISAIVFGVAHGFWAIFGGNWRAALGPMISTGLLGGVLAVVYLIGDRSLAPCAAAHIVINLFLEPWLIISSATNAWGRKAAV